MTTINPQDSPFFAIPRDRLKSLICNMAYMVEGTQLHRRSELWTVVSRATGHGQTTSKALCRHAGLDGQKRLPLSYWTRPVVTATAEG